jgi:leukotriene-A4 hydrolase
MTVHDHHSYAQPSNANVKHLQWDAVVDFDSKTIRAKATWKIETSEDANTIILDTKALTIERVTIDNDEETTFTLGEHDEYLGESLTIAIKPTTKTITIYYQTSPDAAALQWLSPQQTAGKKHPFLFTQSQAILARSWVPCQDSPGIRFTYEASVTVPPTLLALMSATNPKEKNADGKYNFSMRQPIPSYLLALAVGDISFQAISDRSGVYAEPSVLATAANEFVDLEHMIAGAEELYGPYRWERYDLLVLPPSFPFGGMENPRLTFATPTILAGDRSLTSLVAHELAHSWSGNLVTNATWDDFWLNEGFTVYFEKRIMEKLYGKDYAEMLSTLDLQDLRDEVESLNANNLSGDTKLKLNLTGRDPDEGVTDIAYNKGYYFLRTLEVTYGRKEFDQFVKDYFDQYAFKVMTTEDFIPFLKQYYQQHFKVAIPDRLIHEWIYTVGLPASLEAALPSAERFVQVDAALESWKQTKTIASPVADKWSTHEWLHFIKNLPTTLSPAEMVLLDAFGKFTDSKNSEIIAAWGVVAIRNNYQKAYPVIESFLINTGRRKFLLPLYQEFLKTPEGKEVALAIYEKARPNYHYVAVASLDKLLQ